MKSNELLKDIYSKFKTGEYIKVPSIQKVGDHKWAVYFYEDGLVHYGIYYTLERAQTRLDIEREKNCGTK